MKDYKTIHKGLQNGSRTTKRFTKDYKMVHEGLQNGSRRTTKRFATDYKTIREGLQNGSLDFFWRCEINGFESLLNT